MAAQESIFVLIEEEEIETIEDLIDEKKKLTSMKLMRMGTRH